jgi:hypothetical protein
MPRPNALARILVHLGLISICLAGSTAGASVTFTAVAHTTGDRPLDSLLVGDEVTLDIRMSSSGTPGVLSVGAAVHGYDPDVAGFESGAAVSGFLFDLCVPTTGCFQGIPNTRAGALAETDFPTSIGRHVRFADGNSLGARTATGDIDPGLDGSVTDAQFRVRFQMLALGSTTLTVGTSPDFDADLYIFFSPGSVREQATNAAFTVNVIPEPGTALLLGLGLTGLASLRRRT